MSDDPIERMLAEGLDRAGVRYVREPHPLTRRLDFYLTDFQVWVEAKQFFTERVLDQLQRADDVILIQGRRAAQTFLDLIVARGTADPDQLPQNP